MTKMVGWQVEIHVDHPPYVYVLDEVYFDEGISEDEVKNSLIEHDGYRSDIHVKKVWRQA